MTPGPTIVTERELDSFREHQLAPAALLALIERFGHVLVRVAVGVGKSHAVDKLLSYVALYGRFDLVIYVAPLVRIVEERAIISGRDTAPVPWRHLKARPKSRCGELDEEWTALEAQGCSAYGRKLLCTRCKASRPEGSSCEWPEQFSELEGVGLFLGTEKYMLNLRMLPLLLRWLTGNQRVLVILDEARLLDASFELELRPQELERFAWAIKHSTGPSGTPRDVAEQWRAGIRSLLNHDGLRIAELELSLSPALHQHAFQIQKTGISRFGADFRYVAYDVGQFEWSRREERSVDASGVIRFTARPYLRCHALLLSAHHTGAYAGYRLACEPIASPFEHYRFQHSRTRIINLQSRVGADRHFIGNHRQILDTFAVALLRNVAEGRSTILICRKKRKRFVAEYLRERLAAWGCAVDFVPGPFDDLPAAPDPRQVPIIHYGLLGVNDFTEYESAYCVDSYYVNVHVLENAVQEFEPAYFRVQLQIVLEENRRRRVALVHPGVADQDRTRLAEIYLRRLEVDPVIQAAGRVRFLTKPREVVLFQMHDLGRELAGCTEVGSLEELRGAMGLPTARELDHAIGGRRIQFLRDEGLSMVDAARRLGLSRKTAYRRLAGLECVTSPIDIFLREFDTLSAIPAAPEGSS